MIEFKGKKVTIFLKNDFKYEGELLNVDERFIYLNDIKYGNISIALSEVRFLRENGRK